MPRDPRDTARAASACVSYVHLHGLCMEVERPTTHTVPSMRLRHPATTATRVKAAAPAELMSHVSSAGPGVPLFFRVSRRRAICYGANDSTLNSTPLARESGRYMRSAVGLGVRSDGGSGVVRHACGPVCTRASVRATAGWGGISRYGATWASLHADAASAGVTHRQLSRVELSCVALLTTTKGGRSLWKTSRIYALEWRSWWAVKCSWKARHRT